MVLADLGKKISDALKNMNKSTIIDEKILDCCMKDICLALVEADVNIKLVSQLRKNVKNTVSIKELPPGMNKRNLLRSAIIDELCKLLDGGKAYEIVKGKTNILMLVGLQGSGKTTTCTKLAYYYANIKNLRTAVICTDTYRAGAFDQLKQNATKAKIHFYGSYSETDPVVIATEGIKKFQNENFDLVILDTSGRHKQEESLFEEMLQLSQSTTPDNIIFVMDANIGQACESQILAFKKQVNISSVIVTKLDGHAKGGGALSAVALTKSPILFIGTGEHLMDLEDFVPRSFIGKLLGEGNLKKFFEILQNAKVNESTAIIEKLKNKRFDLRDFYEQLQSLMGMGPLDKLITLLPGMNNDALPKDILEGGQGKLKRYMTMMDSMTDNELDSDGKCFVSCKSRVKRVTKGSGCYETEFQELLNFHKKLGSLLHSIDFTKDPRKTSGKDVNLLTRQLSSFIDPQMFQQIGGTNGLQNMMQELMKNFGFSFIFV